MTHSPVPSGSISVELLALPLPAGFRALLAEAGAERPGRILATDKISELRPGRRGFAGARWQWFGALREGRAVGLGALGPRGQVADLLVARDADPVEVLPPLLRAIEDLARRQGMPELDLFLPADEEERAARLLEESGYRSVAAPATTLQVIDWRAFLEALGGNAGGSSADGGEPVFVEIHTRGAAADDDSHLALEAGPAGLLPRRGRPPHSREALRLDGSELTAWLLGGPGPGARPPILDACRIRGGWSTPLGHRR